MPGSWLTRIKPFQAALIAGFLVTLVILGLWGRGNYSLLGLLSVDNREADFQAFLDKQLKDKEPEVRRQYLTRWIIGALNKAETEDDGEQARLATSLEADLREFYFYTIDDRRLHDRLARRFLDQRAPPEDPDQALVTRERIATAAIQGILQLVSQKDVPPPLPSLKNALASLDFVHFSSDDLARRLRTLDAADLRARELRGLLYQFEGPFRKADLFLDAPADFVEAIHALKLADAHYYRHGLVTTLWRDALEGEGIFTIERSGVEVRLDQTLSPYDAVVCRGERELYDAGFFLQRESDGAFTHVHARPSSRSRDCRVEVPSADAELTVWLSPEGAAPLLVNQARPLTAADYPIRGVVLRRSPSHDLLPPMLAPNHSDPETIEGIAAELVRLAGL